MAQIISLYKGAHKIKKYLDQWNSDSIELITQKCELNTSIQAQTQTLLQDEAYFIAKYSEKIIDLDDLDEQIPPEHVASSGTLHALMWDCTSPFLHPSVDQDNHKLKKLKLVLGVKNSESRSIEGNRSESVYLTKYGKKGIAIMPEESYFYVGCYKHMINRPASHIGLMADKPHNEPPIEVNKLAQSILEANEDEAAYSPSGSHRKHEMVKLDTTLNRMTGAKIACGNLLFNIIAFQKDHPVDFYENCYIFINPVLEADTNYIETLFMTVKSEILRYLIKFQDDPDVVLPKFTIVTLEAKSGFTCKEYYVPSKDASRLAKNKVCVDVFVRDRKREWEKEKEK